MQDSSIPMLRLWQLISPALPVGAYAYSQGLEYALDSNWLNDEADIEDWIKGQISHSLSHLDIPLLKRLYHSWLDDDFEQVEQWSRFLIASRETSELVAEDLQLGRALAKLLIDLGVAQAKSFLDSEHACFATLFSLAGVHWQIPLVDVSHGYLWAWLENQVAAAVKSVPLGQTAGQKMLIEVSGLIPGAVTKGHALQDDEIGMLAPAVSLASALHETQYSRLFRS